jgi:hypothetical protein
MTAPATPAAGEITRARVTLQDGFNAIEQLMSAATIWRDRLLRELADARAKGDASAAEQCLSIARDKDRKAHIYERVCGLIDLAMSDPIIMERLKIAAQEKTAREEAERLAAEGESESTAEAAP